MSVLASVDVAGRLRRRSRISISPARPATRGGATADPPTVGEIVLVMRAAGDGLAGERIRGLIVVPRQAGLRIQEALDLHERDIDRRRPPPAANPEQCDWSVAEAVTVANSFTP